jgi:mRNA-degrading endonuclease RelE of RelBE toxin-antitoxin system
MLDVHFARPARKFLEKAEQSLARRLWGAILRLQQLPFPSDVKRVENQWFEGEKVFRIRVGDYRAL